MNTPGRFRDFTSTAIMSLALCTNLAEGASIAWTNTAGGNWSVATNWSAGALPTAADDVWITAAGTYSVTQDIHVTVASLRLGGASGTQTLTNAIANLTLNGASAIHGNGVLGFGGGTLGGTGVLVVEGAVVWSGGSIVSSLTLATNGTVYISGSETKYLGGSGALDNQGLMVWSGTGDIETWNLARIINQPGGLFDIQNNQTLAIYNGGGMTNLGTLRKSAGGGTTLITVPLDNSGILDIQSGSVVYRANNRFNDGTVFTGAGINLVEAGTVTFDGAISSENLEIGGATVVGTGSFSGIVNWTSGTLGSGLLLLTTNGVLRIGGSATKYLGGTATLINHGRIVWSGTNDIQTANSARIINQPGALFDIQNNQSLSIWNGGAITNHGTLRKSAGGGITLITVPLDNSGILDVQSGSVVYRANNLFNDGTVFTGAGINLVEAGTVTFDGAISSENLEIGGAAIAGNGSFSGVVNWTGGPLTDNSTFTVATNGRLLIDGSSKIDLGGTLMNLGVITWSGTNNIETFRLARIINQPGALFDIHNDQSLAIWNGGAITNLGTLRKSAGGGTTLIQVPLHNLGTVDARSGTIAFAHYSQSGGTLSFDLNSLTNFGRLGFGERIAFTGTLRVRLNGDYLPVAGDAFELITYPSHTGAFENFDLPASHAWQTDSSIYRATVLKLTVLNARPTLNPIAGKSTDEESLLSFSVGGSDPDLGQTLDYALLSPPNNASIHPNSGVFSWTPDEAQGPSTNVLTVAVTDSGTPPLATTNTFTVVVREVNLAPALAPLPDCFVVEKVPLTLVNSAADADLPTNRLTFSLVAPPEGMSIDPSSGLLTWTPPPVNVPNTSIVVVRVTDDGAPPRSDEGSFAAVVIPTPALAIQKAGPGRVAVSWSTLASRADFNLQIATNLHPPVAWFATTNPPLTVGDQDVVIRDASEPLQSFRLRKP